MDQRMEPQVPEDYSQTLTLMEAALLSFQRTLDRCPPFSTFWNEHFYNYYSVPAPPFVFWESIIYFLVSQVQRKRGIFPQDGSHP